MFSRLKTIVQMSLFAVVLTMFGNLAWAQDIDFGLHVQNLLNVYSEQLFGIKQPLDFCLVDEVKAGALTGRAPFITRFFAGGPDANYFDNLDFQPGTGRLVVLEDGEVEVQTGSGVELRGNDIWMLLPDGDDRDVQSDGAIRILSLTDTDAEPTGFIFDASGQTAYVNIQHRNTNLGRH